MQKHFHRSEHWVIVEGVATVTLNENIKTLKVGESIVIPKEGIHRIENKEKVALKIVEVQLGDRVDEQDIIRIEDDFNRLE